MLDKCFQGEAEESRGLAMLNAMAEEFQPEVFMLSKVLETMGISSPLQLPLLVRQLIPLFTGKLALFLPVGLGGLDWSSSERTLFGHLVKHWCSGFAIHLQVGLSNEEEMFLGALGVDRMENQVVRMEVVEDEQ